MMAEYDYADDLAFAQEAVAEYGRLVTFVKNAAGNNDADPLGAPTGDEETVTDVKAVFVYPSGLVNLGASTAMVGTFKNCAQVAMVAADGANAFDTFDFITDLDNTTWKIDKVEKFQPGAVTLLYYVGVVRP